ncbi:hypothetical protein [Kingella denitrificans]|jgi:lipoprotein
MKRTALTVLVLMLAACGKGGADRYIGYWQQQGIDRSIVSEIKKENGNYFVVPDLAAGGRLATEQRVLSEKDGELVVNTGVGDLPLKLSDDGDTMFLSKYTFRRIDAAAKDKIVAHEEKCRSLNDAFQAEYKGKHNQMTNAGVSVTTAEYKQGMAEVQRKYAAQFAELQKDGKCNFVPRFSYLEK